MKSDDRHSNNQQPQPQKPKRLKRHSKHPMVQIDEVYDESNSDYEVKSAQSDPDDIFEPIQKEDRKPVRRRKSQALSESHCESQPVPLKKRKYNKKENQGNILMDQARIKSIFKQICDPDGYVTVDSLGHTLQRYHIEFELRDLSEMIGLLWMMKEEPVPVVEEDDRIEEDSRGEFSLSLKLDSKQFEELFGMIRGIK